MISFLWDLAKGLTGLIYPPVCEVCGAKINTDIDETCLCGGCLKKIPLLSAANPLRHKDLRIWSVSAYESVSRECIHLLKYNGRLGLVRPLSRLMRNFTNNYLKPYKFDIIVPVPLYKSRLRERGFNQSELLAKRLGRFTGCCVCAKAVKRTRPTLPQAGLSKTKREINLKGAFKVSNAAAVRGKNVLIIDDVFTTGSTVYECARVLRKAKVKSVNALVLARGI